MSRSTASLSSVEEEDQTCRPSPVQNTHDLEPEGVVGRMGSALELDHMGNDDDEEAEEEAVEWELQENGLYVGSYRRLLALYSFVPLTALLTFLFLGFLPLAAWPRDPDDSHHPSSPYPPSFPSPLPELLLSSSLFALSHLLRGPLYTLISLLIPSSKPFSSLATSLTFVALHACLTTGLRLAGLALLQVRHRMNHVLPTWDAEPAFRTVWWFALNVAEVGAAVAQGYAQIAKYRDVLVPPGRAKEFLVRARGGIGAGAAGGGGHALVGEGLPGVSLQESWIEGFGDVEDQVRAQQSASARTFGRASAHGEDLEQTAHAQGDGASADAAGGVKFQDEDTVIATQLEHDFDKLLAIEEREELEEIYGMPVIKIPVFISCLQRFASILVSLGLTLFLSSAYLRSASSIPASDTADPSLPPARDPYPWLGASLPAVLAVHVLLGALYTPPVLPRIGVHTAAYVSTLVGLGSFFAGLAVWDALS
ncbi:hypothetical protein CONPUDRAFT_84561 [Coniophora puteana RWD-64-598 SS2]|uniref:Uncharacterized protein n=1 Tax=Coniophora puteana (strain RWD-64-598) TaxID=741705 RepID=A0A5M3MD68_CONPW|nr:uncharacterized protein CONPUDRAFT_84561 [Coniophora puteana RWD-64-598 SS2]EIW76575.1 hypothetical protein CONPUDRAFT_84561 [Coniophora puteana RWD-64-598 SS2]